MSQVRIIQACKKKNKHLDYGETSNQPMSRTTTRNFKIKMVIINNLFVTGEKRKSR